jgi:hypothetical protein
VICAWTTWVCDKKREHEFGGVAEADVEQPADGAAGSLGELLGGAADPVGKDGNRCRRSHEDPNGRNLREVAQGE